jgi:hypothetical protein
MNKKLIGYILLFVGMFPILLAFYAIVQGVIIYVLSSAYAGIIPTILYYLIAIGFTMCIPLGIWLIRKKGDKL